MFPGYGNFGQGYPNQMSGYGGGRNYQQRYFQGALGDYGADQPYSGIPRQDRNLGVSQYGARMQQNQQFRGFGTNSGKQKRPFNDDRGYYPKRPRRDAPQKPENYPPTSAQTTQQFIPQEIKDNYVVPVSQGTEKITMAIWKYFLASKMDEEDLKKKLLLRKSLLTVVNGALPDARLFITGSSMTGFATKTSDVDMCLMVSLGEIDQKRDATAILKSIEKALRQCSHVQNLRVIKAKVPILKFFDKIAGVECDLNVNNLVGIRNTHLLRFYAYLDWRVRPLMLFIKKWARFHDINDASKQTVSSYSLSLMLIHYLQVGVSPPVLPCLQAIKPDLFDPKKDVRKLSLNFDNNLDFVSHNRATLGELFLGFLNYYANTFSFETQVISVKKGRALSSREVNLHGDLDWKHLNIEEPFEGSNTARSVYDQFVFLRIMRVFQASYHALEKSRDVYQIFVNPF